MQQDSDRSHPLEGLGIKGYFLDLQGKQGNFFPSSNRPTQTLVQAQEGRTNPTKTCLVICGNSRKSSRKRRKASSLYQCSLLCTFRLSLGHTAGAVLSLCMVRDIFHLWFSHPLAFQGYPASNPHPAKSWQQCEAIPAQRLSPRSPARGPCRRVNHPR